MCALDTREAVVPKKLTIDELRERLADAEERGNRWLADANEANERGKRELAERRYAKGQYWLDVANRLQEQLDIAKHGALHGPRRTGHDIIALVARDLELDPSALTARDKQYVRNSLADRPALAALGITVTDGAAVEEALALLADTPADRQARSRQARASAGGKAVAMVLSPEASAALAKLLKKRYAAGQKAVIERALIEASRAI